MKNFLIGAVALSTLTTVTVAQVAPAQALSFGFSNISGGDTVGDAFASNFVVDVTSQGTNTVLFKFFNNAPAGATRAIEQVSFDSPTGLLSNIAYNIGNIGVVNFEANTANLPQGNNLTPSFTVDFGAQRVQGNQNANRINAGEALGLQFTGNFANVIAAIQAGNLRMGIHVTSLDGSSSSDSYVNSRTTTTAIPTPALLPGLIAMGLGVSRKKKQVAEVNQDI